MTGKREKEKQRGARNGNENFLSRGANRTRGFPRCEISRERRDKEGDRSSGERCDEGDEERRRKEKDDGKRKDRGREERR